MATIVTLLVAGLFSRLGWFRHRVARRLWLLVVIVVIGLWSGNLISLALVAGWSAEGVAWKLAPGLSAIMGITLLLPPLTKGNPYCNHLCPHGALQQLIKPSLRILKMLLMQNSSNYLYSPLIVVRGPNVEELNCMPEILESGPITQFVSLEFLIIEFSKM